MIILLLDGLEEQRALHISEWNFGYTVKDRLSHLVSCKRDYWKKTLYCPLGKIW
jgi:hypothetical protein